MPSYPAYNSPTSPPHGRYSPTKSSPLRHALSTRSDTSDTDRSSIPSRHGTLSSNTSSAYSNGSCSSFDASNDPFVTRSKPPTTGAKRERSESPVKRNAAFAKWEQRDQAQQDQRISMDVSPKKAQDQERRSGVGRSESRAALRPVARNVLPVAVPDMLPPPVSPRSLSPSRKENDEGSRYRRPDPGDVMGPPPKPYSHHGRGMSLDMERSPEPEHDHTSPTNRNSMATLSRSDSMRTGGRSRQNGHARFGSTEIASQLDEEDLAKLQKSSTPQFRHLSKMASEEGGEEFGIHSRQEQVVGLAGRKKLQRSGSVRPAQQSSFASQYSSTRWMDTQRKHLQAYEYLCHIGEARAWLEDVLDPAELPPIVQLEEALRDGVTLAEAVVRLAPSLPLDQQYALGSQRIFKSARLQFRHSDNIALFFRFLAQVELPELFRFELVDLYEKKNIPKVIYCIHALSWLLYRKGIVEFRIGNLVGQLQFEEHELEETQKGIDRSGVQMPNFGGMRAAMQVEDPEPTPEELIAQHMDTIVDLQSQMRGALTRLRLGGVMQELWDAEESIALLQTLARGSFARQIFDFKYAMNRSTTHFQAAASAFLVRMQMRRKQRDWKTSAAAVVKVQSLWRGKQQRVRTQLVKTKLQRHRADIRDLQATIRGALGRWRAGDLWHETREAGAEIDAFQAIARAALGRMRISLVMNSLWDVEPSIVEVQAFVRAANVRKTTRYQQNAFRKAAVDVVRLQAVARGLIHRRERKAQHGSFQIHHHTVTDLQCAARGLLARLQQARVRGALQGRETTITKFQTFARAQQARRTYDETCRQLEQHEAPTLTLQSLSRAFLARQRVGIQLGALEEQETAITTLQSLSRAYIVRTRIFDQLVSMEKEDITVTQLQAFVRAMLLRSVIGQQLAELEDCEQTIVDLQAAARAFTVRAKFEEKRRHYRENMQKVIKLQSFVRAKQQGESYKSLVSGKNPPLPVVRRHLHLLTDSQLEFEGEIEAERLRRQVIESVRRNELVEGYVEGLDVKIALLVKNKITLDEVVKHQKHFGGSAAQLLRNGSTSVQHAGGFDLKALNKSSRKKLTGYEELFFVLQTQPAYLSRLFAQLTAKGHAEQAGKNLERLMLTLFGYAQKSREEYFLIRLFDACTQHTVQQARDPEEVPRLVNAAFFQRLILSYVRSPRDRKYLKSLLGGMVRDGICGQDHMDLESDPLLIYRAILNNEELSTGVESTRPKDLPREVVIREPDVRPKYVEHLQDLRDLCDTFFAALEQKIAAMPYGIRYVAATQYRAACEQFPHDDPGQLAMMVGNWLWKSYLLPALKEPEMWGVVDRGLGHLHRRNLAAVMTVLSQVVLGRLFGAENLYLQPLNSWLTDSMDRWHECLGHLFDITEPEEWFDADQFSDLYCRTKPTVYVKLQDIFALHALVADNLLAVAPTRDDPIRELLTDLGTAKGNESDLSGAANGNEITLTLKSKFTVQEDPHAENRALFTATKRLVLYIIKVQSGSNLMEILLRPISHEDADRWIQLMHEEVAEKQSSSLRPKRQNSFFDPKASLRGARTHSVYSEAPSAFSEDRRDLLDLQSMTYAELKSSALENIITLEQPSTAPQYRVSRHNNYQELLNALASDIRQKHRRRLERQREVDATRATLAQLDTKAQFLDEQLKSYNDYIEQCLHTLASKKGAKHKFTLPFTKQWAHERELERRGRQPRFGSYKYSARQLADKGVLVEWAGYPQEHWGQLNVVISSDEVGVFHFEASSGSLMVPGASANLLLDDLLQAQYDNRLHITVFGDSGAGGGRGGGGARLAVNLLLHLVFKKFYRDE